MITSWTIAPVGRVRHVPFEAAAGEGAGIDRAAHRPFGAEDRDPAVAALGRVVGDDLGDVQAGDRKGLARRLERDMGAVVGQDEEIGAGGGELLRVGHEDGAQGLEVAAFPGAQRVVHGDSGQSDLGMVVRAEPGNAFEPGGAVAERRAFGAVGEDADMRCDIPASSRRTLDNLRAVGGRRRRRDPSSTFGDPGLRRDDGKGVHLGAILIAPSSLTYSPFR